MQTFECFDCGEVYSYTPFDCIRCYCFLCLSCAEKNEGVCLKCVEKQIKKLKMSCYKCFKVVPEQDRCQCKANLLACKSHSYMCVVCRNYTCTENCCGCRVQCNECSQTVFRGFTQSCTYCKKNFCNEHGLLKDGLVCKTHAMPCTKKFIKHHRSPGMRGSLYPTGCRIPGCANKYVCSESYFTNVCHTHMNQCPMCNEIFVIYKEKRLKLRNTTEAYVLLCDGCFVLIKRIMYKCPFPKDVWNLIVYWFFRELQKEDYFWFEGDHRIPN